MYYYNNELPPKQGWICPKCGRVNAPWMPTCGCVSSQTSGTPYLVEISSISRDGHEIAKDEPQTEMTTEQIVNELLSIKQILDDGKMPKQTHDIRTETHACVEDEPQTDNGIGCSRCEGRFDCYDRDMPNAVHCNNYGKVTDGKE